MKDQIQIAAKMYRCQESAKKLFKEEYPDKIKWYKDTLSAVMVKEKLPALKAVLFVSNLSSVKDNGMAVLLFMAAAVELIEN